MWLEFLPEALLLAAGTGGVLVYFPEMSSKVKELFSKEEYNGNDEINKGKEKRSEYEVSDKELLNTLNHLYELPDGNVRPLYMIKYYTILYEIKNKVKLKRTQLVSPVDFTVIDTSKTEMVKIDSDNSKYSIYRGIEITKELNTIKLNEKLSELNKLSIIRDRILKNNFIKEYMDKTKDNRLKYMDNTDKVILNDRKLNYLMEDQERLIKQIDNDLNSELENLIK